MEWRCGQITGQADATAPATRQRRRRCKRQAERVLVGHFALRAARTSRTTSLSCQAAIRRADRLNTVRSGPAIQEAAGSRGCEARDCAVPSRSTRSAGTQRCVWCRPGVALHRDGCANLVKESPTRRVRWRSWRLARTVGHADTLPTDRFRAVSMRAQRAPCARGTGRFGRPTLAR